MRPGHFRRIRRWLLEHTAGQLSFKLMMKGYLLPGSVFASLLSGERLDYVKRVARDRTNRTAAVITFLAVTLLVVGRLPEEWSIGGLETRRLAYYALALIAFAAFVTIYRLTVSYSILFRFMTLLRRLEENRRGWDHLILKRWLNSDLRRLANFMSRMPATLRANHPDVVLAATRKAAAIRNLQVLVPKAGEGTEDDLYGTLLFDFLLFTGRSWSEMPEAEPDITVRLTLPRRLGFIFLGLTLFVGAIWLILFAKDYPSISPVEQQLGVTVLLGGAYLFLAKAGLIPGTLQEALDTADKVKKAAGP